MSDKEKEVFEYTYSTPTEKEKKQIESIRRQYAGEDKNEQSPFERLKMLDRKVKNTANCVALIFGVIGCLVFGLGMAMVLEWQIWVWGILIMVLGSILMLIAYPAYNIATKHGKNKYGKEILELSEHLLKNNI